jgi:hypothetical protein
MARSTHSEEKQMATTLRQQLEAAGFKTVPDNQWIYSEGPLFILIPPRPSVPLKANTLAQRLLVELSQARREAHPVDATDVESLLEAKVGEAVTWAPSNDLTTQTKTSRRNGN